LYFVRPTVTKKVVGVFCAFSCAAVREKVKVYCTVPNYKQSTGVA
jgi:hypothetical protein